MALGPDASANAANAAGQDFLRFKAGGMGDGAASIGRPQGVERIFANGYAFGRPLPFDAGEIEYLGTVAERDAAENLGRLVELREQQFRPEVEAIFNALQRWASDEESLPELMSRFEELGALSRRLGELHSLSFRRAAGARAPLGALCAAEFGAAGAQIVSEAIGGMPQKSLESAGMLWQLSRETLARPAVAELLREGASSDFVAGLDTAEGGAEFRTLFNGYLDVYGHRNESCTRARQRSARRGRRRRSGD